MFVTTAIAAALASAAPDAAVGVQASAPAPVAAAEGVIGYPPEFFASFAPSNALEMVQRLPGFSVDVGADVRGFGGAAGNVLIDGERPASKTDNLEEILRRLPASQVARIDLIRGGAPGIDMQGQSVIANVIRKADGGAQGLIALSNNFIYDGRQTRGFRLEGSGKVGPRAWEAGVLIGSGVDDGAGDGPAIRLDAQGLPTYRAFLDTDGDVLQMTLTGALESPLAGGKLRVNARVFDNLFEYDETAFVTLPDRFFETGHDEVDELSTEFGGRYSRDFGPRTSLELVSIQQNSTQAITSQFRAPGESVDFARDSDTGETIGRAELSFRQSETLSWQGGGEAAFNWLEGVTSLAVNGQAADLPAANVRVEERRGELFGKAVWRARPGVSLEAGLRAEGSAISSEGDVALEKTLYFIKPRAAATWDVNDKTQLRLRIERVVGQLDFEDFVASDSINSGTLTAGNPDLEPAQEWVVEAAAERRFWDGGALVLTARRSQITGVNDRVPVEVLGPCDLGVPSPFGACQAGETVVLARFDAPGNIGEGVQEEVEANLTLPFAKLGLRGAQLQVEAQWRRSEVTDPATGEQREISGVKPVEWEARFSHDLPRWRATWGVNVFGGFRETYYRWDQVDIIKLKTFVAPYVDLRLPHDVTLRLEVQNATERGLRRTTYRYPGGRGLGGQSEVQDRDLQFGRMVYVRVRKTLGG